MIFLAAIFLSSAKIILFISIFIIGGFFIVIEGIGASILSVHNPNNLKSIMNLSQTFFCVGCVAGPLIAGLTLKVFDNWRTIYLLNFVLIFIMMLLFIRLEDDRKSSKTKITGQANETFIKNPKKVPFTSILLRKPFVIISTIVMLLYVGIEEGFAFWMISYIEKVRTVAGLSVFALSAYWLFMGVGRLMASNLKKQHNVFMFTGMIISMISVACIYIFTSAGNIALLLIFAMTGFGLSSIWPLIMADTVGMYPEYSATTSGILMTSGAGGAVLVPFIMGVIAEGAGMRYAFVSIFFMVVLMIILFVFYMLLKKKNISAIRWKEGVNGETGI